MAENTSIPTLTLDPNGAQAAAQAVSLEEEIKQAAETTEPAVEKIELEKLSPEEQAAVKEFSSQIDVMNTEQVMNYGAAAQKNISEFSDAALSTVKTKDLGEVGTMLSELVVQLKGFTVECFERSGATSIAVTRKTSVSCRFQNRKICGDQNRNGFGSFRLRFQPFLTLGLLLKRMEGRTPCSGLLSTTDTVSSMCWHSHTFMPFAHSVGQNRPSARDTRPRLPTTVRDHSDQTSSHHPSCGIARSLQRPSRIALSHASSGVMPISRWVSKPLR